MRAFAGDSTITNLRPTADTSCIAALRDGLLVAAPVRLADAFFEEVVSRDTDFFDTFFVAEDVFFAAVFADFDALFFFVVFLVGISFRKQKLRAQAQSLVSNVTNGSRIVRLIP